MRLEEANIRFNSIAMRRFGDLFSPADLEIIRINKGKTGQLLELALGMHLSCANLDFDDGELKTNKCDACGNPRETVFITQISSIIDELIQNVPFEVTHLYEKSAIYCMCLFARTPLIHVIGCFFRASISICLRTDMQACWRFGVTTTIQSVRS